MNRNRRPQNWLNLFTLICLLLGSTPAAAIFQKKLPAATATDSSESIVDSESSLLPNAERGKREMRSYSEDANEIQEIERVGESGAKRSMR